MQLAFSLDLGSVPIFDKGHTHVALVAVKKRHPTFHEDAEKPIRTAFARDTAGLRKIYTMDLGPDHTLPHQGVSE